jgi:hypothetical protein
LVISDGTESITVNPGALTFAFPTLLQDETDYTVTVTTNPTGKTCTVTSGATGIVNGAAVNDVVITCQ